MNSNEKFNEKHNEDKRNDCESVVESKCDNNIEYVLNDISSVKTSEYTLSELSSNIESEINENVVRSKPKMEMKWFKKITVEIPMFLYMMAFSLTNVVEQSFYIYKVCINNGYTENICNNLPGYPDINIEVQLITSTFHKWFGIGNSIPMLVIALFIGSWSDKRGRKAIIISGLTGKIIFSIMFIILSLNPSLPIEFIIYSAVIPGALTGGDMAIFSGCFAYIADITNEKNRTFRVGMLNFVALLPMPIGVYAGSFLFTKVLGNSYTNIFTVNFFMLLAALVYTIFVLKWQTSDKQQSLKSAGVRNPITDFFDKENVKRTFVTLFKPRPQRRRMVLWFLLISMGVYTFQRDQRPFMFLYTIKVFGWGTVEFSNFRTFTSAAYVIVMFFGIPLMSKKLRLLDTTIVHIGCASLIAGHLMYAFAKVEWFMYLGALVASLGPCIAPLIRSITSKVLDPSERGVAFAFLSVMEYATTFVGAIVYSNIYNATIHWEYPNAIFYFTISNEVCVFVLTLIIQFTFKTKNIKENIITDESIK